MLRMASPGFSRGAAPSRAIVPVLRACLAALAALVAAPAPAQPTAAAPALDAVGLLARLYPDADCAQQRVIGVCHCGSLPCGIRLERYVPVAIVETTRAPGDSLVDFLPVPAPLAGSTVSSALSMTDNTAEVHVWSVPGVPLPGLGCVTCGAADAALPAVATEVASAACGPVAPVVQALRAAPAGGLWGPRLAYASELDALNWRTGCRDLTNPALALLAGPSACLWSRVDARPGRDSYCLERWGSLIPRQMRDIGPNPLLYSAKTALRGMSVARDQIGNFPFPVDTDGQLQQAYPALSACFRVGQLPLPQAPLSGRPALVSPDGRYAWIYWRRATCCVGFAAAQQCLRAR
jgi:hypothetical protein